ncbi:MAG: M23 family metallopeptidase [Saprospiraceae bacterium]|nr:M23 family metallopeptidase [Saprospiraceae bacterium]MBK7523216.1 M23 family metallopeptidase [Saprospiraceae bacterium]MBK8371796.1 M23 family metallopeptidase [Saprospiraceae bacterium]MBK8547060.1 M23 family metallopeptidase [Saprospiraceae bacterium]MBK8819543.1 M23 family metallopeptidase [Saprospiraceae bacterium]
MSESGETKRKLWERLKDTYRITILDDENLEEIGSYNVSLLNFYIFISVIGFLLSVLVISFIVFTPVKRLIPGYGDITDNRKFIEISEKVDALEKEVAANELYTKGLKNLLSGADSEKDETTEIEPQVITSDELSDSKRTQELNFLRFITPVTGAISAAYQPNINHYGVDIIAPKNTPIKSVMGGVIISADWTANMGNTVYIQHQKNVVSVYKHLSISLVKTGDLVNTGQVIGIIGNSGEMTTGPHLHFEFWYDGKSVNPASFINFNK